jgi:hypothetical protein
MSHADATAAASSFLFTVSTLPGNSIEGIVWTGFAEVKRKKRRIYTRRLYHFP